MFIEICIYSWNSGNLDCEYGVRSRPSGHHRTDHSFPKRKLIVGSVGVSSRSHIRRLKVTDPFLTDPPCFWNI